MRSRDEINQMSQEILAKKNAMEEKLRALFTPYEGLLDGLEVLKQNAELVDAGWNQNHLFPVFADTIVYKHPDQSGIMNLEKYVKVIYGEHKFVAVLAKHNFE